MIYFINFMSLRPCIWFELSITTPFNWTMSLRLAYLLVLQQKCIPKKLWRIGTQVVQANMTGITSSCLKGNDAVHVFPVSSYTLFPPAQTDTVNSHQGDILVKITKGSGVRKRVWFTQVSSAIDDTKHKHQYFATKTKGPRLLVLLQRLDCVAAKSQKEALE